ncbi:hypothetical protein BaRGS_00020331 [Batillaria attramentaria]|uniref:Uncharacterized protein n=1 Tax=Batillaria attramentaria TaxID=370345 RepID=A0ABD0KMG2_9CAEN
MASTTSPAMTSGVLMTCAVLLVIHVIGGAAISMPYSIEHFNVDLQLPKNRILPIKDYPYALLCELKVKWKDPSRTGMVKMRIYKASNNETVAASSDFQLPPLQVKHRQLTVTYGEAECHQLGKYYCHITVTSTGVAKPERRMVETEINYIVGCDD